MRGLLLLTGSRTSRTERATPTARRCCGGTVARAACPAIRVDRAAVPELRTLRDGRAWTAARSREREVLALAPEETHGLQRQLVERRSIARRFGRVGALHLDEELRRAKACDRDTLGIVRIREAT